jgi:hypothetical protein
MHQKLIHGMMICAICLMASAASADTPSDVRNLVGESARYGDDELGSRGYVHISTQKGADRAWSYWWNSSRSECISVVQPARLVGRQRRQRSGGGHRRHRRHGPYRRAGRVEDISDIGYNAACR